MTDYQRNSIYLKGKQLLYVAVFLCNKELFLEYIILKGGTRMLISTDKLKDKEVINIADGKSIGFVYDIEVDLEKGVIDGIVIPGARGIFNIFSKADADIIIKWERVKTVGDDVILVDVDAL